jgi:NAD(P)-dependent dehydrogenase (short-subunit alcohol dehydrogenase family)
MRNDHLKNLLNFSGRVVIVAGAGGGGMGTHITQMVADAGGTVIAVDNSQAKLDKDIAPLQGEGRNIVPFVADVLSDAGIASVMDCALKAKGDLYGLVTVVGGSDPIWGPSIKTSRENWDKLFALNLDSMFFMTQAVARHLKATKKPGSLVSIASVSGLNANPHQIAYGASKAALISVMKTLALELAADGIRLNTVAPGAIATPQGAVTMSVKDDESDRRAVPMARQGRAEEIASTVFFLLSEMSSYITGHYIAVDGGMNLKWAMLDEQNVPVYVKKRDFLKD